MDSGYGRKAELFNRGKHLFHAGHVRLAEPYWREYLTLDPDSATGYYYLSVCLAVQRKGEEALKHADMAVSAEPESEWGYIARAHALNALGRPREALSMTSQALGLAPERLQALALSAWLESLFGSPENAKVSAERGLEIEPQDLLCHLARAQLMTRRGESERARNYLKEQLAHKPENPILLQQLAWATLPNNRKVAEQLFESALELNPESESSRRGFLMGKRVPHLGILWNLPQGWIKVVTPLLAAYLFTQLPLNGVVVSLFAFLWLNRSYSNLMLSLGRWRKLLTDRERVEGPLTIGTFLLGVAVAHYLDFGSGVLICLLATALEQFFDFTLSATLPREIPLLLGCYLSAWFLNPWFWAIGYCMSWYLSQKKL